MDERRHCLILDDVLRALEEKRSPILLTERKDHLAHLAIRLRPFVKHLFVLRGGMTPSERREVVARLASIPGSEPRLVVATGRYIGEGFDDARLDTLFLTMPVSWKGILIRYAGRLHRLHPGQTEVRLYDYVDRQVPLLLQMFEKRLRGYRATGYARAQASLGDDVQLGELPGNPSTIQTPEVGDQAKRRRSSRARSTGLGPQTSVNKRRRVQRGRAGRSGATPSRSRRPDEGPSWRSRNDPLGQGSEEGNGVARNLPAPGASTS